MNESIAMNAIVSVCKWSSLHIVQSLVKDLTVAKHTMQTAASPVTEEQRAVYAPPIKLCRDASMTFMRTIANLSQ